MADGTRLTQEYLEVIATGMSTSGVGKVRATQTYLEVIATGMSMSGAGKVRATQVYAEVIVLEIPDPTFPAGPGGMIVVTA